MDILAPNLGATEAELQSLHTFAQDYLKQKADREAQKAKDLEDMRSELNKTGKQFSDLYAGMKKEDTISTPLEDGSFLVVKKGFDRLRMAHTTDQNKNLEAIPTFDDISEWQEVTIDGFGSSEPVVRTAYHWSKEQLDEYKQNSGVYWGKSTQVRLGDFRNVSADVVVQSFEEAKIVMRVPQTLLDSVKK